MLELDDRNFVGNYAVWGNYRHVLSNASICQNRSHHFAYAMIGCDPRRHDGNVCDAILIPDENAAHDLTLTHCLSLMRIDLQLLTLQRRMIVSRLCLL